MEWLPSCVVFVKCYSTAFEKNRYKIYISSSWVSLSRENSSSLINSFFSSSGTEYDYIYFKYQRWHPTPVLLLGKSMDRGAWWAAVHGVTKSRARLNDFIFTFHFHALEKKMATHSSVLAWRIPGAGKSGGLPSLGSHRVRHDWSDLAAAAAMNI